MTTKLFLQALCKYIAGIAVLALLLFVPAGTLRWGGAWLFLGLLFVPMLAAGIVLMGKNPALLQKRLDAKEEEREQKIVVALSGVMFLLAFVLAGLNYRFAWLVLPKWVVAVGAVLFLAGYAMYAEVMRENTYLSRTVEVQEEQQVIDTGLYGIMRHPMYSATLLMFLSMGIVLGSLPSFGVLLFYIPIIARRIKNEERVLEEGLPGYREYKMRVKYKVLPYLW